MIDENIIESLAHTIDLFMNAMCRDGDVCVLFGKEHINSLVYLKDLLLAKRTYMQIAHEFSSDLSNSEHVQYHISDMRNENIVLTTDPITYKQQPSWVGIKIRFFNNN